MRTFRVADLILGQSNDLPLVQAGVRIETQVWHRVRAGIETRVAARDWPIGHDLLAALWEETRP